MIIVLGVLLFIVSGIFWILSLIWMLTGVPLSDMKNWARRIPVVWMCLHAALWVIYPKDAACIMFFFLWFSIVLMDFLPSERNQ